MSRTREKPCDRCHALSSTLYRVQFDGSSRWFLICEPCWLLVQPDNDDYRYGGTWKSKKRH